MKLWISLAALVVASADAIAQLPRVVLETEFGVIEMEIDTVRAPISAMNFLRYVDSAMYTGGRFHRTVKPDNQPTNAVKIEVIQGGIDQARRGQGFGQIALERTNKTGILHKDGVVSMARGGPDTATSDFFICIGDQPSLDFGGARNADGQGFAAFGKVVRGMDVVKKIQQAPVNAQNLTPPIRIISAKRAARVP